MKRAEIQTLHWVCNSPSPYNDQLFRSLSETLPIRVQFHFTQSASPAHLWKHNPSAEYPSRCYSRRCGIDWHLIRSVCGERRSLFLTNCWQDLTSQIILLFLMVTNRPYWIWNDTPSVNRKRSFIKKHFRRMFLRLVFRKASAVMGTGKTAMSTLAQMGCPLEKLVDFPYFIDLDEYSPIAKRPASGPVIFGSCGRLHHEKGYDLALRALARAYHANLSGFRYRLAGTGPEAAALRELAHNLGIANHVEFLGWLDPKELPHFYQHLDFFLHPARTEPYGVSVLEAMASGAIVIASDQTAAALDRIEAGANGFLHACGDADNLSCTILQAVRLTSVEIDRIRTAARQSAEDWPTSRGAQIVSQLVRELNGDTKVAAEEASTT